MRRARRDRRPRGAAPAAFRRRGLGDRRVLTLLFELGVFHLLVGHSRQSLLADYDVGEGRLWPLVLVTELVAPRLALAAL